MPNSGFGFSVSYKKWTRPEPGNDPEDALYPDITVYATIDDFIGGSDTQLERLKALLAD